MSNEIKMTDRKFYEMIIASDLSADIVEHAKNKLTKMNERNEKRASTPSKTQKENEPIKAAIMEFIATCEKPMTAAEVFAAGVEGVNSTAKASAMLTQLANARMLVKTDIKVKGKGTCKAYSLPAEEQNAV